MDIDRLDEPATLVFVTSGSRLVVGDCGPGSSRLVREHLVATTWWRLELRTGPAITADLLALTNPVYVTA